MPKLTLVPVPIGNLNDITKRSIESLLQADIIFCEDTRSCHKLLKQLGIENKKLMAFHSANEHKILPQAMELIKNHQNTVYCSEAGTPGISDPGYLLVRSCIEHNIPVECLPGPVAFIPALVVSGLPMQRFYFEGFLPHKKGREKRIRFLSELEDTFILYESPHRLLKTLQQLIEFVGPDRQTSVSREISKLYEETVRGTLASVHEHFSKHSIKGEFVIVVAGKNH
ncbi:MAG: ribosomal RNA small subunit methyltransferase I [Vicingaceae bacterium]|nr:MAG: ribosomal RNA small subunit methyltransferase I [Vicingaceae bacterium]